MKARTCEELKEIDRKCAEEYCIPTLLLMEHAAQAAAQVVASMNPTRRQVLIIVGKGNNGGDGLALARLLKFADTPVKVWLLGGASGFAKESAPWYNLQMAKHLGVPIEHYVSDSQLAELKKGMETAGLIVDAMLGTGLSGDVRAPFADVIKAVNELGARVLAIDVPSGLDAETGEPKGVAVRASKTITFVAPKVGFATRQGGEYCGEVIVADIGVPPELL